jgi:putative toxin-antitoxin system antitoxin component (TIGR02293 family)
LFHSGLHKKDRLQRNDKQNSEEAFMNEIPQDIMELAVAVFSSDAVAKEWLHAPQMGLNQQKPVDLVQTAEGAELVKSLLTRMQFGTFS